MILDGTTEDLTSRLVLALDELVQSVLLLLGEDPSLVVVTGGLASPLPGGLVQLLLIIPEGTDSQDLIRPDLEGFGDLIPICQRTERWWKVVSSVALRIFESSSTAVNVNSTAVNGIVMQHCCAQKYRYIIDFRCTQQLLILLATEYIMGNPAALHYPFGMHTQAGGRIPWKVELFGPGLRLRAVAEDGREGCTGKAGPKDGPCGNCAALEFFPKVTGEQ